MLNALVHNAQTAATRTAHTAVLGLAAGVALTIGAGFLTLAAWLLLLSVTTALYAAVTLGLAFAGIGLVIVAVMSIRSREHKRRQERLAAQPTANGDILNQLVMTFMAGMTAGQKARL